MDVDSNINSETSSPQNSTKDRQFDIHNSYHNNSSLQTICELRLKNPFNPLIGYLNINSLRNKIIDVREILTKFSPDYFVFAETKIDQSFPSAQFSIDNYEIRNRKDRDKNGGGLIEYVKKGVICKQINNFDICNEIICSELTVRNKKWVIFSVYRPPSNSNLKSFFGELETLLDKFLSKYDKRYYYG